MEKWDVYDKNRKFLHRTHERGVPIKDGDYHIVAHAWIRNNQKQLLLTKRHPNKPFGDLWEYPGGSIMIGESSLQGVLREIKEEIGVNLDPNNATLLKTERRDQYHDFNDIWLFDQEVDLSETSLQPEEVMDIKWVSKDELNEMEEENLLVPLVYIKELFD
ncbi:NUDIX hydrolase [Radiobacillus deserti]|uniref:8-oxo-dGTP diphosphatase n=1 Tax=Radiobacillus deserti TaxID=2594883 RepID=A0A516KH80_9BACI|nr:NUDIX domain-containing protein [Radiobacillus deserti]QDP40761.1 NUDIX domain-containing protein [Radiobacillus deserti]